MTRVPGGSEGWRSAQRATAEVSAKVPEWLTSARTEAAKAGFNPTSTHIERLAGNISSLNIAVLLRNEPIEATGLTLKLDTISKSSAYQALMGIAESGYQRQPVSVSLEDAVALHKRGQSADVQLLADIHTTRRVCGQLLQLGADIVLNNGAQDFSLSKMSSTQLKAAILEHSGHLQGKGLSDVLDEWGK